MVQFANSVLTVKNGQVIAGTEYGDAIGKAIAKAVADAKLEEIGVSKDTEDDGSGVQIETGKFVIDDETKFANWMTSIDKKLVIEIPEKPKSANLTDGQVWLTGMTVQLLPQVAPKVTGKVLRYHASVSDGNLLGLALTFMTIESGKVKEDNTTLLSTSYLEPLIGKGTLDTAKLLDWADKNIQGKVIVLGKRETVAGKTGYFKSPESFNDIETKAYGKLSKEDKLNVKRDERGRIGFIHRVSNTNFNYTALASTEQTLQFNTAYSRLSELVIKIEEKRGLDTVDLETLAERNKINARNVINQISVAKEMLDMGLITQALYDEKINTLMKSDRV